MPHPEALQRLTHALRSPLALSEVTRHRYGPGPGARDTVVSTNRLILILNGSLKYTYEDRSFRLKANRQFFVPAWSRRHWLVPEGGQCEILWYTFTQDSESTGGGQLFSRLITPTDSLQEQTAFEEIQRLWRQTDPLEGAEKAIRTLLLEAQLKAVLARFWSHARPMAKSKKVAALPLSVGVRKALSYLEDHFTRQDVLKDLPARCQLTPNYLREQFRAAMGVSPGEYVKRLRMRQARHLLHATDWQQKRIAAEVGYPDACYFSRAYRQYWGYPPGEERKG